jgi:hypothetical protein
VALAERGKALQSAGIKGAPTTALTRAFEDPVPPELASDR